MAETPKTEAQKTVQKTKSVATPDGAPKTFHWENALTVISVAILVGTELVGMTWAAAWALGGLFELPAIFRTGFEIVGFLLGVIGLYYFVRAALKVEPLWQ